MKKIQSLCAIVVRCRSLCSQMKSCLRSKRGKTTKSRDFGLKTKKAKMSSNLGLPKTFSVIRRKLMKVGYVNYLFRNHINDIWQNPFDFGASNTTMVNFKHRCCKQTGENTGHHNICHSQSDFLYSGLKNRVTTSNIRNTFVASLYYYCVGNFHEN